VNKSRKLLVWHREMRMLSLLERGTKLLVEVTTVKTLLMIKAVK
jgi:hypothetical protein